MTGAWHGAGGVPAAECHMTLAFLGTTGAAEKAVFMEQAQAVGGEAFTIRLGRLAIWEKAGVVVLEPVSMPASGVRLAERLREGAARMGRPLQEYRPHVTLARGQKDLAGGTSVAVDWLVEDFVLARSDPAASPRYAILARWPLS